MISNCIIILFVIAGVYVNAIIAERYQVEANWNLHHPIHEVLTTLALKSVKICDGDKLWTKCKLDFIRGVIWMDDPNCWLFDDSEISFSSGANFASEHLKNEKISESGETSNNKHFHTHFGSWMFKHSQTDKDEPASMTRKKILKYFKDVLNDLRLDEPHFKDFFIGNVVKKDIPKTFCLKDYDINRIKKRIIGILLHTIQDSYAAGHTLREEIFFTFYGSTILSNAGCIKQFTNYKKQDVSKHGKWDSYVKGINLRDNAFALKWLPMIKSNNIYNSGKALISSIEFLNSFDDVIKNNKWSALNVNKIMIIVKEIFTLCGDAKDSGAGVDPNGDSMGK